MSIPHQKSYSHYKFLMRSRSTNRKPQPNNDQTPSRKRCVTYSSDAELLKSIQSQESLFDLIDRERKRKKEELILLEKELPQTQIKKTLKPKRLLIPTTKQEKRMNKNLDNYKFYKDPVNASRSLKFNRVQVQIYLDKEFQKAKKLDTSVQMPTQRKWYPQPQSAPRPPKLSSIHPKFLSKTQEIFDLCYQYLST